MKIKQIKRHIPVRTILAAGLCTAGLAHSVHGGSVSITPLLLEGDSVPEVGLVNRIDNLATNNNGDWLVEADTNNPNTDIDTVLILNDNLFLQEGQLIDDPTGASIDSFDSININVPGNNGWNLFLDGTAGGSDDDSGVYFKTTLLIQESAVSTAAGFSDNTTYEGFFDVKINDNNDMLVLATIDDPNIAGSVNRGLVLLDVDDDGMLLSETVVAKESDVLPGQSEAVEDFETGPHDTAFNDSNQTMYIAELVGSTASDSAIYIDDTLIAQEGSPSPVAGRNYGSLSGGVVDLNNNGDYVFRGLLDGDSSTNTIIISNGSKVVQEGDPFMTSRGSFPFTSFGFGPVAIADTGDILWYGEWDDPNSDIDSGLFLNDALIVQEGVTNIDGEVVDDINGSQDGFDISPNGQFIIFEGTLVNGQNGAFFITVTAPSCPADIAEGDNVVNVFDLLELLAGWGTDGPGSDLDEPNDTIDVFDLLVLLAAWGPCD